MQSKEASPGENAEKDKEIAELRMEGTKLSEKQLKLEGILKKLRVKEKEQEVRKIALYQPLKSPFTYPIPQTKIADLTSRLDSSEGLLETKVKRVKELEESDRYVKAHALCVIETTHVFTENMRRPCQI